MLVDTLTEIPYLWEVQYFFLLVASEVVAALPYDVLRCHGSLLPLETVRLLSVLDILAKVSGDSISLWAEINIVMATYMYFTLMKYDASIMQHNK